MGRKGDSILPRNEQTKQTFENLCKIQCTREEIAGVFEVSDDTLLRWCRDVYNETFATIYKRYSASGRASLRRHQFKQAEKSAVMGIWLGKQHLGQSDQANIRIVDEDKDDPLTESIKNAIAKRKAKKRQEIVETEEEELDDEE